MRKHKLLLPLICCALIILFGTSYALGIFTTGNDDSAVELSENDTHLEQASLAQEEQDLGQDPEQEDILPEEALAEEDQIALSEVPEEPAAKETAAVKESEKAKASASKPVNDKQMVTVNVDGLNVRPDPSTTNQPIDVLSRGQKVEMLKEQNNWIQVKLPDGRIGLVSGTYVDKPTSSSPTASGGSLSGKIIAIDPGHGGSDPGAVGVTGLQEKEINLDVALRAASKLRALGAKVIMTRDTDVFIPLTQRVSIADAAGAQVFVSVHANAHPNPQIGGTETYYFGNKATSAASRDLATHMQRQLVGALGLRDIGVKDANFLVIRQTSMPSTLLELGFLSNAHEESLMRADKFRQNAADAMVRALQNYFGAK